jgi:hypothetical protein
MAHFGGKLRPSFGGRPSCSLSSILLILLLSAFLPRLHAQTLPPTTSDDQMGDQAYQSYHGGDIDSVSLTNGTLSLNFPFLSYPQRGALYLGFSLMYNNQSQHQGQLCLPAPAGCKWWWGYPSGGTLPVERSDVYVGWAGQFGLAGQFIPEVISDGKVTTDVIFFSNWSLQMADGSKHPLANMGTFTWTTNAQWCGADGYQSPEYQCVTANGPFETLDATGWRVNGSLAPCLVASGCIGGLGVNNTAIDPNGVMFAGTIQDPNGRWARRFAWTADFAATDSSIHQQYQLIQLSGHWRPTGCHDSRPLDTTRVQQWHTTLRFLLRPFSNRPSSNFQLGMQRSLNGYTPPKDRVAQWTKLAVRVHRSRLDNELRGPRVQFCDALSNHPADRRNDLIHLHLWWLICVPELRALCEQSDCERE